MHFLGFLTIVQRVDWTTNKEPLQDSWIELTEEKGMAQASSRLGSYHTAGEIMAPEWGS